MLRIRRRASPTIYSRRGCSSGPLDSPPNRRTSPPRWSSRLSKVSLEHIRLTMVANLRNVDEVLATRVADGWRWTCLLPRRPPHRS